MSAQGILYNVGLNTSPAAAALSNLRSGLSSIGSTISGALAPLAALAGAASLTGIAVSAIGKAADRETLTTAFMPLLGSADAAEARMKELAKFAAETPFELPEIAKASATLETLTQGALSTGKGLTLVGDLASATNQPFSEIAVSVGRLYDGLNNGRPVGEAMQRLQELGGISGETRAKIEALSAAGKNTEAWAAAEAALAKFSGGMKLQSGTWNGLLSTLQDNIGGALAEFGAPIMDSLKPLLEQSAAFIETLGPTLKAAGQQIADIVNWLTAAFSAGELGNIIGGTLIIAFKNSVNFLWSAINGIAAAAMQYVMEIGKTLATLFGILTTGQFWAGIGKALQAAALGFAASLLDALNAMQGGFAKLLRFFGANKLADTIQANADTRAQTAQSLHQDAAAASTDAGSTLDPFFNQVTTRATESLSNIASAYTTAAAATAPLLDTAADLETLADSLATVSNAAAQAKTDAATKKAAYNKPPTPEDGNIPAKAAKFATNTDSLAKIGGFVGNATSARDRAALDTAKNTALTAKYTERLATASTTPTTKTGEF